MQAYIIGVPRGEPNLYIAPQNLARAGLGYPDANLENRICKSRRDKTRQGNKKMIKFTKPAYNQFERFTSCFDCDVIVFNSCDGEEIELDKDDLFDAFRVISSTKFTELIGAIESYANARKASHEAYENTYMNEPDSIEHYAEMRYLEGLAKGIASNQISNLAGLASYFAVCNAVRMYEALYGECIMDYVRELV